MIIHFSLSSISPIARTTTLMRYCQNENSICFVAIDNIVWKTPHENSPHF